jgi:hypothetical protein
MSDKKKKKKRPDPKSVVQMVKLEPYVIQFMDGENQLRNYYAFRNPNGSYFLLDMTPEGPLFPQAINVPEFTKQEGIEPTKLGPPRIFSAPGWLREALNAYLENPMPGGIPGGAEDEEEAEEATAAMKAAAMEEEDNDGEGKADRAPAAD